MVFSGEKREKERVSVKFAEQLGERARVLLTETTDDTHLPERLEALLLNSSEVKFIELGHGHGAAREERGERLCGITAKEGGRVGG
jgi:hypothetical protein